MNYAWPSAEIAVMGASGAAEIISNAKLLKLTTHKPSCRRKYWTIPRSLPTRTGPLTVAILTRSLCPIRRARSSSGRSPCWKIKWRPYRRKNTATFRYSVVWSANEVGREGMFNIIDWKSGMKIDFIVRKNDPFQQAEFNRRQRKTVLANIDCWIISPEDLIIAKLLWIQQLYSQQQADDIKNLMYDLPTLDKTYVKSWISKLKLNDFGLFN